MPIEEEVKQELMKVRRKAKELYSEDQVREAIGKLAAELSRDYADKFPVFVTIMNGGLIFAGQLLTRLDFPLEVDYLHASRYLGDIQGGAVQWIVTPSANLEGRDVVIVDDILDVGSTLLSIIDACKAQGAKSVSSCVLVDKQHNRKAKPGWSADYTALFADDFYLFGMGMDYKGYWRNAPGIFALAEEH